jgi:hypothetical protein
LATNGVLVADQGVERRGERHRFRHAPGQQFVVGTNAFDAMRAQRQAAAAQVLDALVQRPRHDRLEGVGLQLAQ